MKTYILLLNYNGWQDTQECLESVLKLDSSNYQIIVVDNKSPNQSMDHLIAWAKGEEIATVDNKALQPLSTPHASKPIDFILYDKEVAEKGGEAEREDQLNTPIIFIQAGENKGFAAGNNIAIKYALAKDDFDYIYLLNNDTVVEPDSLSSLVSFAAKNSLGITGAALFYYDDPKEVQCYGGFLNAFLGTVYFNRTEKELNERLEHILGAAFLIDKKVIEKIGLLPEEYFLYYEETDYCFNAQQQGFTLGIDINSIVYHKEGASIGISSKDNNHKSEKFDLLSLKNRAIFHRKYLGGGLGLWVGLLLSFLNRLKRGQFKRAIKVLALMFDK